MREDPVRRTRFVHTTATEADVNRASLGEMQEGEQLNLKQTATNYWVVERGPDQIAGGLTREAAEAERELVRRLRRRTAQMRSAAPRRPRAPLRAP
jgi:hypothetical protein